MNMIELQDRLKGFSQEQLIQQMQAPDGSAPQFMVLSEITRRKKMQDEQTAQQAKQGGATVAEEVIAAAGVPQQGLPEMAAAMAPKSSIAQNTGIGSLPQAPQGMYAGGPVRKMAEGGKVVVIRGRRFVQNADGSLMNEDGVREAPPSSMAQADTMTPAARAESLNEYYPNANYIPVVDTVRPEVPGDFAVPPFVGSSPSFEEFGRDGGGSLMDQAIASGMKNETFAPETPVSIAPEMSPEEQYLADRAAAMEAGQAATAVGEAPVMPHAERAEANLPPPEFGIPDGLMDMLGTAADIAPWLNPIAEAQRVGSNAVKGIYDWATGAEPPSGPADRDRQAMGEEIDAQDGSEAVGLPPDVPSDATVQPQGTPYSVVPGSGGGQGAGGGGGGSGGSSGAGQSGGYISELEAALQRAEKVAEQDKWLALAQAGMALMASDSPTLGGAIGEAGVAGLEGFRSARDTYENTRMSIMEAIQSQKMAAAKAAGGGGGGGGAPSIDAYLKGLDSDLSGIMVKGTDELGNPTMVPRQGFEEVAAGISSQYENLLRQKYGMGAPATFDATQ